MSNAITAPGRLQCEVGIVLGLLYENPGAMRMGTLSEFGPIIGRFEPPLQY